MTHIWQQKIWLHPARPLQPTKQVLKCTSSSCVCWHSRWSMALHYLT